MMFQDALARHQQGDIAQAQAIYREILRIEPQHAASMHLLGVTCFQTGQPSVAVNLISEAIRLNPDYAEAYSNRGIVLHDLKRYEESLKSYDEAIRLRPAYAEAFYNRGIVLHDLKRYEESLKSYDEAIRLKPTYAEAYSNRGIVLHDLKRYEESVKSYDDAIRINPSYAEAHSNRGYVLRDLKRYEESLKSCDDAIRLNPAYAEAHSNRGNALHGLKRYEESLKSYDEAIRLNPGYVKVYYNRGVVFHDLRRYEESVKSYDEAIRRNPTYVDAHWNKSVLNLLFGYYDMGWAGYEWRFNVEMLSNKKRDYAQPLWSGKESLDGKKILIYAEQGLGDTIQFCRYAMLLREAGATVFLDVPGTLVSLMRTLDAGVIIVESGDLPPEFDYHCPLLSLPGACGTTLETIPHARQYLHADAEKVRYWNERLGLKLKPRIGLAWSGNIEHIKDHLRSIALKDLLEHLPDHAEYLCLQKEIRESDRDEWSEQLKILHTADDLHDFSDTAALIECLDLVVCVDTSVAHLAGALGKPTWVLLPCVPDWRWLLDRDDSPWYPSVKLYRQDEGREWPAVLERVKSDIAQFRFVAGG